MTDLSLTVLVTRGALGLGDLDINDHVNYYVTPTFLGGQVSWDRVEVTSPFIDGSVTVNRRRSKVQENIGIEVLGDSQADLATNLAALIAAFTQDGFALNIGVGAQAYQYACEAADYQLTWSGPRSIARQALVAFTVPRQPNPIAGPA